MDPMRPHIVFYKGEEHPQAVLFQNKDGGWGRDGELETLLGLDRGKGKKIGEGSSSQSEAYHQMGLEAAYYEGKFEICLKALEDLRDMHKQAALRLDLALFQVKDLAPGEVAGPSSPTKRDVVEVSEDGPSKNEGGLPTGTYKRRPYTRSRAASAGKRGRGRKS